MTGQILVSTHSCVVNVHDSRQPCPFKDPGVSSQSDVPGNSRVITGMRFVLEPNEVTQLNFSVSLGLGTDVNGGFHNRCVRNPTATFRMLMGWNWTFTSLKPMQCLT